MKGKEPILYNDDKPLAHYDRAGALKRKTDKTLKAGKILPFVSLTAGIVCVFTCGAPLAGNKPLLMALFTFFGIIFTLLGVIACQTRRQILCFLSVPFGFSAALVLALTGSLFAPIGTAAYIAATIMQISAMSAISDFIMLKELPGFPFFDPGMDNLTFAALDRRDADEFIDESQLYEERSERVRLLPTEPPSNEMKEIITEGMMPDGETPALTAFERETAEAVGCVPEEIRDNVIMQLGHLDPNLAEHNDTADNGDGRPRSPYERMINAQAKSRRDISDVELFG